jgi:hypothetical protein
MVWYMARLPRLLTTLALLVAVTALSASPALARTRDHDRMSDRWEMKHHLNVKKNDANRDRDRDGLSNYGEYRAHTNPRKKDSDHDGRRDGREDYDRDKLKNAVEIRTGYDPGDADSDNDGIKDGRENAGKITRLSDSSVTIKLAVGGKLTARLGEDLAVDCKGGPSGDGADPEPGGDDAPGGEGEPSEDATDPADDETSDDPAAEGSGDDREDVDANIAQDPADEDGEEFDESAFDEQFEDDFANGGEDCGTSALKVGARVHEATVERTASGPVIVAIKLRR